MREFIIEREIPGIGAFSKEDYKAAARKSNEVLAELGDDIEWLTSYVAADQTFCLYRATGEEIIMEHARLSGFPANRITEVIRSISPRTAEE